MRASTNLFMLAAAGTHVFAQGGEGATGELGDAKPVDNNPAGVVYTAVLPEEAFHAETYPDGGNIEGSVSAVAADDGLGVQFTIKLSNLPKTGGPFAYHLHKAAVPADGNCTSTLSHLDPYKRGDTPPCDADAPETCEVGDLSGKHGKIPAGQDTFEASYLDLFASTAEDNEGFFGSRSVVVHLADGKRLTCANFELAEGGGGGGEDGGEDGGEGDDEDDDDTPCETTCVEPTPSGSSVPGITDAPTSTGGEEPGPTQSDVVTAGAAGLRAGFAGAAAVVGAAVLFML